MTDSEFIGTVKTIIKRYPILANIIIGVMEHARRGRIRRGIHWLLAGHLIRRQRLRRWQAESGGRYIQVGGGRHLKDGDGWINGDMIAGNIYLNAARRLPLPDNTLDVIFTEQFIEHLSQQDALNFLREAWRVLKPGGIIRQSTPDLGKLIGVYEDRHDEVSLSKVVSRHLRNHRQGVCYTKANGCQFLNDLFRLWGHQALHTGCCVTRLCSGSVLPVCVAGLCYPSV